jgi:hypothetical protein
MKEFSKINNTDLNTGVASLPLRPNQTTQFGQPPLSGKQLQERFDHLAKDIIAAKFNELIDILSSTSVLSYFKITDKETLAAFVETLKDNLIDGQLSATDPEDEEKKTVDAILITLYAAIEAVKTFVAYEKGEQTIANIYATKNELTATEGQIASETTARQEAVSGLETELKNEISSAKEEAISTAGANAKDGITAHNEDMSAHSDLRSVVSALKAVVDEFFAKDADNDANLDRLVEIVTLINSNQDAIDTISTNKVNVSDIVDNLTDGGTKKPLSAAQGVVLKALVDGLTQENTKKIDKAQIDTSVSGLTDNDERVASSALVKSLLDNFEGGGGLDLPADAMSVFTEAFLTNGSHGLLYHLYDDEEYAVCIGMGECTETNIDIGSIAKGYPVTKVGVWKQLNTIGPMFTGGEKITSLVIPDSVTEICVGAFGWCQELVNVRLSKSLREIPVGAFSYDLKLTEIMIPSGVSKIGEYAFLACYTLSKIYIPRSIETIESYAFATISADAVVYYEGSAEDWGKITFPGTSGLENANINYNYTYNYGG